MRAGRQAWEPSAPWQALWGPTAGQEFQVEQTQLQGVCKHATCWLKPCVRKGRMGEGPCGLSMDQGHVHLVGLPPCPPEKAVPLSSYPLLTTPSAHRVGAAALSPGAKERGYITF